MNPDTRDKNKIDFRHKWSTNTIIIIIIIKIKSKYTVILVVVKKNLSLSYLIDNRLIWSRYLYNNLYSQTKMDKYRSRKKFFWKRIWSSSNKRQNEKKTSFNLVHLTSKTHTSTCTSQRKKNQKWTTKWLDSPLYNWSISEKDNAKNRKKSLVFFIRNEAKQKTKKIIRKTIISFNSQKKKKKISFIIITGSRFLILQKKKSIKIMRVQVSCNTSPLIEQKKTCQ